MTCDLNLSYRDKINERIICSMSVGQGLCENGIQFQQIRVIKLNVDMITY